MHGGAQTDNSDNERMQHTQHMFGGSDGEGQGKMKHLGVPSKAGQNFARRNRSDGGEDDEDQFIVGPSSTHSKIRQRDFGQDEMEEEKYLLL